MFRVFDTLSLASDFPAWGHWEYIYSQARATAVVTHLQSFRMEERAGKAPLLGPSMSWRCWSLLETRTSTSGLGQTFALGSIFATVFQSFMGLEPPPRGTVTGGAHGRTGSTRWWFGKFMAGWVGEKLSTWSQWCNYFSGQLTRASEYSCSQGPCGLVMHSNVGFPWDTEVWDPSWSRQCRRLCSLTQQLSLNTKAGDPVPAGKQPEGLDALRKDLEYVRIGERSYCFSYPSIHSPSMSVCLSIHHQSSIFLW